MELRSEWQRFIDRARQRAIEIAIESPRMGDVRRGIMVTAAKQAAAEKAAQDVADLDLRADSQVAD